MSRREEDVCEPVNAEPPAWWTELQAEMGRLLRTPLDSSQGRFRAPVEEYSLAFVAAVRNEAPGVNARLALYHEQYWRRLFTTIQTAFPRTASVIGHFWFNGLVSRYLEMHPPRGFDLSDVGERFFPALMAALEPLAALGVGSGLGKESAGYRVIEDSLRTLQQRCVHESPMAGIFRSVDAPWSLVTQALHLDEAERRAFRATGEAVWSPSPEERARLRDSRLRYAGSFSLLRLDYELPLSQALDGLDHDAPRRKTPMQVVVVRGKIGVATQVVDPVFARLLARGRLVPLGEAVAQTESALQGSLREHLHRSLDDYIRVALTNGWWVGV